MVLLLATGSSLAILPTAPAGAAAPGCGSSVSSDVVLTKDLRCSGSGLLLQESGLTIDLNGHSIIGSGTGIGISTGGPGPETTTIINGVVKNFATGINASYPSNVVTGVTLRGNTVGIDSKNVTVSASTFIANGTAVQQALGDLSVYGSTFKNNGVGLDLLDVEVDLTQNIFVNRGAGVSTDNSGVRISDSSFRGGGVGVLLRNSLGYSVRLDDNSFTDLDIGTSITGATTNAVISENSFRSNGASGLYFPNRVAAANTISGNTFNDNGFAPGAYVDPSGNSLSSGLWANKGAQISNSTANANAGYGIEGHGVVDAGGNRARNNLASPQCIGVVCS